MPAYQHVPSAARALRNACLWHARRVLCSLGDRNRHWRKSGYDGRRQICALAEQLSLNCAHRNIARRRAAVSGERGRDARGLTGEPTLGDFAQEGVRARIAGDMAARAQNAIEPFRHQRSVWHRDIGRLRRQRGRDADLVVKDVPAIPLLTSDPAHADEPPAVPHADLRRAEQIAHLAIQKRLPTLHFNKEAVKVGILMSYGADLVATIRRQAYFVDRILKGTKPADLPVEEPTKFELAINLKTAKALSLAIPDNLLAIADEVID